MSIVGCIAVVVAVVAEVAAAAPADTAAAPDDVVAVVVSATPVAADGTVAVSGSLRFAETEAPSAWPELRGTAHQPWVAERDGMWRPHTPTLPLAGNRSPLAVVRNC